MKIELTEKETEIYANIWMISFAMMTSRIRKAWKIITKN